MPTAKKRLAIAMPKAPSAPRATIDQVMLDQRAAPREGHALEARDLLVGLRHRRHLGIRYQVLDALERLVAAALPYLAQDGVGRVGPVHEDEVVHRLAPRVFVFLQRDLHIRV